MADLIDKVVATENDMGLLRQQLERERAKRQQMAATGEPGAATCAAEADADAAEAEAEAVSWPR